LNYSRLLLSEGKVALAAKILAPWKNAFASEPDAYLFYYTLGEIHHEMKTFDAAEAEWQLGRASAEAVGDRDYVAMCASRLAEVLEAKQQLKASEGELRIAIRSESEPTGKALLLVQMLRVQLANRDQSGAEKTFVHARNIAGEHQLHTVTVDIHVMIGDYYWCGSRRNRLDGLKAYMVAIVAALQNSMETYREIVVHVIAFLTRPRGVASPDEFARLAKRLEAWVSKNITSDPNGRSILLWPIALLKRVLPLAGDQRKMANELERLAKSGEIFPTKAEPASSPDFRCPPEYRAPSERGTIVSV
jgi:hypothetical protein